MTKRLTIWSTRFTPAKGNHFVAERQCAETEALQWLAIFHADEPKVCFLASSTKPRAQ